MFTSNYDITMGLLTAAREQRLRIPEDLDIFGFDCVHICSMMKPPLPVVHQPEQEIGTTAHEWGHLFDHINGEGGMFSYSYNNGALPNALKNARPMSDRVKNLIETGA